MRRPTRDLRTAAGALLAALGAWGCGGDVEEAPAPPNVLLICLDTLRADHLGFMGHARETAPFLARLAEEATVFEAGCSTSSWTSPATASILTGLYPTRHGVTRGFFAQTRDLQKGRELAFARIAADEPTLPELLRAAGYTTRGLATNINIGREIGFDRGFDSLTTQDGKPAEFVHAQVKFWGRQLTPAEPWFVYLHFNDVHLPYVKRPEWFVAGPQTEAGPESALYDSEIGYLDAQLEQIFASLPVTDDTLVVIVADHGEEFLDHGGRHHEFSLYAELNRVLFLVRAPGAGVRAQRVTFPVSLVDVAPTVLELAGLEPGPMDGRSLADVLRAGPDAAGDLADRIVYAHRAHPSRPGRELWSAVRGNWKLISGPRGEELYDLARDPGETENLRDAEPERLAELLTALEAFRAQGIRVTESPVLEIDEQLERRLEELGYTE